MRVLVVDDNADSREAIGELLRSWGHEVLVGADGCEGITLALEHRPDMVLVDIGLPDMDGHEVARRIRGVEDAPILIAFSGSEDVEAATATDFDAYVVKGTDPDVLRAAIEGASRG